MKRILLAAFVTLVVVSIAAPAFSYGRQIKNDGNDTRSMLDLKRVIFRYTGGKIVTTMSTHDSWRIGDIATVARAGDANFYIAFDTSGDFRGDYYVGVYRIDSRLVGIIREFDGARVGDRIGQVPVVKRDNRIKFRLSGSRVSVQGDEIHWSANTKDRKTCTRLCLDQVPNERWAVYRF